MASRLDKIKESGIILPSKKDPSQKQEKKKVFIDIDSNIRSKYSDDGIDELSESIKQYGQLEPIRIYEQGNRYNM
jgi:hypothetical protein